MVKGMKKLLVVAIALCAACSSLVDPPMFEGAHEPPADWRPSLEREFRALEACSGLTADFSKLTVYLVPAGTLAAIFSPDKGAAFYAPATIFIEEDDWDFRLLGHEYMHYLLGTKTGFRKLDDPHPPYYFKQVCGEL